MEIINRSDAVAAGFNKYFTGSQCKNGHIDFRYTKSGACQSCIAENNGRPPAVDVELSAAAKVLEEAQVAYRKERYAAIVRSRSAAELARSEKLAVVRANSELRKIETARDDGDKLARQSARGQMVQARFRLHDVDRGTFAASVWAMAVMRYPVLTLGDVDPNTLPQDKTNGTGLYAFYCHHEDVDTLRKLAVDIERSHMGEVDSQRVSFINRIGEYLPKDSTPPMSFK